MKKYPTLTSDTTTYVMLKDYGDTTNYVVLHICKNDTFVKVDKRIKSEDDFKRLYGYEAKFSYSPLKI